MATFEQITLELKRIIDERLGAERVQELRVTWHRDHAGEPALSLGVTMKKARQIPDARKQGELTHELVQALEKLSEDRFPYLYFDALDEKPTADDVDEFESLSDRSDES